jgi:hypothetical protein
MAWPSILERHFKSKSLSDLKVGEVHDIGREEAKQLQ